MGQPARRGAHRRLVLQPQLITSPLRVEPEELEVSKALLEPALPVRTGAPPQQVEAAVAHLLALPSHSTAEPEALRVAQQPPVVQGAPLGHRLAGLAAQIRMELAVAVAAAMQQEQTLLVLSQVPVVQAEALGLVVEEEREALEAQHRLTRQAMGPLARSVRSVSGPGKGRPRNVHKYSITMTF